MCTNNKQKLVSLFIGVILGLLIWVLSPILTGELEPWDAQKNAKYYPIALFLCGFIACIPYPHKYLSATFGVFVGQILFLLFFRFGPFILIGTMMVALYNFVALFGALFCSKLLEKRKKIEQPRRLG